MQKQNGLEIWEFVIPTTLKVHVLSDQRVNHGDIEKASVYTGD